MISVWHFNAKNVFNRKEGLKYQLETVTLNKAQALKWLVTVSPSYYVGGFISHMCPELEPVLNKDFVACVARTRLSYIQLLALVHTMLYSIVM